MIELAALASTCRYRQEVSEDFIHGMFAAALRVPA